MNKQRECGKISTSRKRFICPACTKQTLLFLTPKTVIQDLPVKCKRCGKEIIVNISPEPEP